MSAGTARILRDAARGLEKDGWCQGKMFDGTKSCALGAITRVAGWSSGDLTDATLALGDRVGRVAQWNDEPGRTQAEVVKAFLTTADAEEFS